MPADEAVPNGGVEDVGLGLCAGVVRGEAAGEDEAGAGEGGVGAAGQHRDADLAPRQQHCRYKRSEILLQLDTSFNYLESSSDSINQENKICSNFVGVHLNCC